jgi:hypothetical protein
MFEHNIIQNTTLSYVNGKIMKTNTNNLLDQYFTKDVIAKILYKKARTIILRYKKSVKYSMKCHVLKFISFIIQISLNQQYRYKVCDV